MLRLLEKKKNIAYYPIIDGKEKCERGSSITKGDLHANALTFISHLVQDNVLTIIPDDFEELNDIYEKEIDEITQADIDRFTELLAKGKINLCGIYRLIGDEVADRAKCCLYILLILERLDIDHVDYRILLSNHGMEFIIAYETLERFRPTSLKQDYCHSMLGLQKLIDKRIVARERVLSLIENHYKKHLYVIDYDVIEETNNEGTVLSKCLAYYFHAPFGDNTINEVAKVFNVPCLLDTTENKEKTLTQIENAFRERFVKENRIHILQSTYVFQAIWNRNCDGLTYSETDYYIHGHDGNGAGTFLENRKVNLDNIIGKDSLLDYEGNCISLVVPNKNLKKAIVDLQKKISPELCNVLLNSPDQVNLLISKNNIISLAQAANLENLFCREDSLSFWSSLIGNNEILKKEFLISIRRNYINLDILVELEKRGLLNKKNLEGIISHSLCAEFLYPIILILNQSNNIALSQQTFDLIMDRLDSTAKDEEEAAANSMLEALIECRQRKQLSEKSLETIIAASKDLNFTKAKKLTNLVALLNPELIEMAQSLTDKDGAAIYDLLILIKKQVYFKNSDLRALVESILDDKNSGPSHINILLNLQERKILTNVTLPFLMRISSQDLEIIYNATNFIDDAALVPELINFILHVLPVLAILEKNNCLDKQNIDWLIENFDINDADLLNLAIDTIEKKYEFPVLQENDNKESEEHLEMILLIFNLLKHSHRMPDNIIYTAEVVKKIFSSHNPTQVFLLLNQFYIFCQINSALIDLAITITQIDAADYLIPKLHPETFFFPLLAGDSTLDINNNFVFFISYILNLHRLGLLSLNNLKNTMERIEWIMEIQKMTALMLKIYGPLDQSHFDKILFLFNHFANIEKIVTSFRHDQPDDLILAQKYINMLASHKEDASVINHVLLFFIGENKEKLALLFQHIAAALPILRKFNEEQLNSIDCINEKLIEGLLVAMTPAKGAKFYKEGLSIGLTFSPKKPEDKSIINDNSTQIEIAPKAAMIMSSVSN